MDIVKSKFLFVLCVCLTIAIAHGQNKTDSLKILKVGLYESPPFVMDADGLPKGMAIDLWEQIAEDLELRYRYITYGSFKEILEAAAAENIDVAVTNLTITEDRAQLIDFTQPWYDAGLRIMVGDNNRTTTSELIQGLKDAGHLNAYLWLFIVIVVVTIAFTIFDRKFDTEFPKKWREGLAESFYAVMVIATTGNLKRKNLFGWVGRIFSALWLVIGIVVLAYLTSSITSVMTTLSLSNEINGIEDLKDKKIGVIAGSVSENFATRKGFDYRAYEHLDDAVNGLNNNSVEALFGDAPVLEYYTFTNTAEPVKVVGKLFHPDKYGFGLPEDDDFTRLLTIEILKAQENGNIEKLRLKYFGQDH